jgi:hypothetical protein
MIGVNGFNPLGRVKRGNNPSGSKGEMGHVAGQTSWSFTFITAVGIGTGQY